MSRYTDDDHARQQLRQARDAIESLVHDVDMSGQPADAVLAAHIEQLRYVLAMMNRG